VACPQRNQGFDAQIREEIVNTPSQSIIGTYEPSVSSALLASANHPYGVGCGVLSGLLSISSSFTSEPIQQFLEFWGRETRHPLDIEFAPYNQIFQSLLDPHSLFSKNRAGANVILLRWQDLGNAAVIEKNGRSLIQAITRGQMSVPLIVVSCLGSPAFLGDPTTARMAAQLDQDLSAALQGLGDAHFISGSEQRRLYPVENYDSPLSDELAHIPYTAEYLAAIATAITRKIDCLRRTPSKVIVLDLDNTLWEGVVGEDGPEGVKIDAARVEMQRFLLNQRAQGMLLAIASKNNEEEDAWEVFRRRPEMVLKPEHFAAWRINWDPKAANIDALAAELSLGLESFIFIDDNLKEIAEVESNLPQVRTLCLPDSSSEIVPALQHYWPFDQARVTAEDEKRSQSYQQEKSRNQVLGAAKSLEDFIAELDLQVTIEPFRPEMLGRVSQLTQRTNQFNTTTIRRNESELKAQLDSGLLQCVTIAAADRFGDYGNVGAVLYSLAPEGLNVDSFLLSCRALGRGVEYQIVRHLGDIAQRHHLPEVWLRFQATKKNAPALRFLESLPASREQETGDVEIFRMNTADASQLVYRPVSYGDVIREEKSAVATPEAGDYGRIATSLRTPEQIEREARVRGAGEPVAGITASGISASSDRGTPRSDTERKLISIWAEVLGLPEVGIYDSFFDLGGDSLKSVDLLMRIIETFDADHLTLSAVVEAPTVSQFAQYIEKGKAKFRCLVPVRTTGSRPNFFVVPGAGGNVVSLSTIAVSLPDDQPFWCLQAPGLDRSPTMDNASDIAALYVAEVRALQPHGPYYLGGGSYGGVLALEMAQQLFSQGETVAFLAMFDTYNLAFGRTLSKPVAMYRNFRFLLRRLVLGVGRFRQLPVGEWPANLRSASKALYRHAGSALGILVSGPKNEKQPEPEGPKLAAGQEKTEFIKTLERVRIATQAAVEAYVPTRYPGKITVLRAKTRMVEPYEDHYLGWTPIAEGGIACEVFEGNHISFEDDPNFGPTLNRLLREAQYEGTASSYLPVKMPGPAQSTASSESIAKQWVFPQTQSPGRGRLTPHTYGS
jgi:FkbH-like protein